LNNDARFLQYCDLLERRDSNAKIEKIESSKGSRYFIVRLTYTPYTNLLVLREIQDLTPNW